MIYIKKWLEYYEQLFPLEQNQLDFFGNLVSKFNSPAKLLSVECGPGLLSRELLKKNCEITAIDTHSEFINIVKSVPPYEKNEIHPLILSPMDIGRYLGKNFYDIIFCCNYRIIFLGEKSLIQKFIFDSKQLLKDGGYLILDLINFTKYDFSTARIDLPSRTCKAATLYSYIIKNSENMTYNLNQQVVTNEGKVIDEVKFERISPISLESFKIFAQQAQFSSVEFFSDYKGTPLSPDSDKIICVLKK